MTSQLLANALISASLVFVLACGFGLIYRVTRCLHFAHGMSFTAGAYMTFLLHRLLGLPLIASLAGAAAITAGLGVAIEVSVYRPLRRRGASSLSTFIASMGLYVALQNVVSICFGDDVRTLRSAAVREGVSAFGARITPPQMAILAVAAITLVGLAAFLRWSAIGRAMRATASDPELAVISGIETGRVIIWTFVIGSALAGMIGGLAALDTDMTPSMGLNVLMLCIVAVVVGGVGSVPGVALGALLLATAQHFCAWGISAHWQDAVAFVILLVFLVARPRGFLGRRARQAMV